MAEGSKGFKCPRHGSGFTLEGKVTKSPARKPLPRFGIRVNDQGRVVVDPSKRFGEGDWDEPDCFVSVGRGSKS